MVRSEAESSTAKASGRLRPDDLKGRTPLRSIVGRNASKGDVLVYRLPIGDVAVKDCSSRPFIARHTAGRFLIARECRAYRAAAGAPGLATFLGRLGPFALATAWIDATPLADLVPGRVSPEVFDRLDAVIDGLHARGVTLGDLHHRDVLVGEDGRVHVVDLAAAHVLGASPGALRRFWYDGFRAQDRVAAARLRARYTGLDEKEALSRLDPAAIRRWRAGRRIKTLWDRLRGKET